MKMKPWLFFFFHLLVLVLVVLVLVVLVVLVPPILVEVSMKQNQTKKKKEGFFATVIPKGANPNGVNPQWCCLGWRMMGVEGGGWRKITHYHDVMQLFS